MVLAVHSDAGFHNKTKGNIRAGAHIFLSENKSLPKWNGPVPNIVQIIKIVMSSALEAKLGTLYIPTNEMILMRNTLE